MRHTVATMGRSCCRGDIVVIIICNNIITSCTAIIDLNSILLEVI